MPTIIKGHATKNTIWFENTNAQRLNVSTEGQIDKGDFIRHFIWFDGETTEQREELCRQINALGPKPSPDEVEQLIFAHGSNILNVSEAQLRSSREILTQAVAHNVAKQFLEQANEKTGLYTNFGSKKVTLSVSDSGQLTATAELGELTINDPNHFVVVENEGEEPELVQQPKSIPGTITFSYTAPNGGSRAIPCPDLALSHPETIYPLLPTIKNTEPAKKTPSFKGEFIGGITGGCIAVGGLLLLVIPGINVLSWLCFAMMALGLFIDGVCAALAFNKARQHGAKTPKISDVDMSLKPTVEEAKSSVKNNLSAVLKKENKKNPNQTFSGAGTSPVSFFTDQEYVLSPAPATSAFFSSGDVDVKKKDSTNVNVCSASQVLSTDPN